MQTVHCIRGSKGLQPWSLFAFIEHFDRILAIILVPVAILQRITTLMNDIIPSNEYMSRIR